MSIRIYPSPFKITGYKPRLFAVMEIWEKNPSQLSSSDQLTVIYGRASHRQDKTNKMKTIVEGQLQPDKTITDDKNHFDWFEAQVDITRKPQPRLLVLHIAGEV